MYCCFSGFSCGSYYSIFGIGGQWDSIRYKSSCHIVPLTLDRELFLIPFYVLWFSHTWCWCSFGWSMVTNFGLVYVPIIHPMDSILPQHWNCDPNRIPSHIDYSCITGPIFLFFVYRFYWVYALCFLFPRHNDPYHHWLHTTRWYKQASPSHSSGPATTLFLRPRHPPSFCLPTH